MAEDSSAPPLSRKVVAALPGDRWKAYTAGLRDYPVLAWLVYDDGSIEPVALDGNGRSFRPLVKVGMFLHCDKGWESTEKFLAKRDQAQTQLERAAKAKGDK